MMPTELSCTRLSTASWRSICRRDSVPGGTQNGFVNDHQTRVEQRSEIRNQLIRAGELVARTRRSGAGTAIAHCHTHSSVELRS
jgi:hypothetical protein